MQIGIGWLFLMGYLIFLKGIFLFASLIEITSLNALYTVKMLILADFWYQMTVASISEGASRVGDNR